MCVILTFSRKDELPTVYGYFGSPSEANLTGLIVANQIFTLNGKEIRIISGAIHYFRVHPNLWRTRLRQLRAVGANAVETYIPWNLHEPRKGQFDFGLGQNDFSQFLDLRRYVQMAQEEDLLVILRPGPYITAEWDFGGLPSWLQRDPNVRVREDNKPYLDRVQIYFDKLLPMITDLQFTRGGPVIALQIENEYSNFSPRHPAYLEFIKEAYDKHQLNECLYFTADNVIGFQGNGSDGGLPGILQTANFRDSPDEIFGLMRKVQPDMPLLAMEFWSGWFTPWGHGRLDGTTAQNFSSSLEQTLGKWNASVNIYMFHGGTNFGFMAGGNRIPTEPYIHSDITSYDYTAPISEAGDYTEKFFIAAKLIAKYSLPKLRLPPRPPQSQKKAYPPIPVQSYLTYDDIILKIPSSSKFFLKKPVSMEHLPMNNDSGQSFGYVIYRTKIRLYPDKETTYRVSYPRDIGYLIVDGKLVSLRNETDYWINSVKEFKLRSVKEGKYTVDVMVESMARINYGNAEDFIQQKGIPSIHNSSIQLNGKELNGVEIIAAEFSNSWIKSLTSFKNFQSSSSRPILGPVLMQFTFYIEEEPADTFLDMSKWNKGIVFVNGFNIGRYWRIGPQQHLYVPAPLLRRGKNVITVFENVLPHTQLVFSDKPNLGEPPS